MKKAFYIGLIFGGILGVTIALSMDLLLGGSLGGGWKEAVANDLGRLLGTSLPQNHIAVVAGVIFVIGIIGAFGAIISGIFFVMVARLFSMLTKEN